MLHLPKSRVSDPDQKSLTWEDDNAYNEEDSKVGIYHNYNIYIIHIFIYRKNDVKKMYNFVISFIFRYWGKAPLPKKDMIL